MITKEQAVTLSEVFFIDERKRVCKARRNGKTKTWVNLPDAFSFPVKYGLYQYFRITSAMAHEVYATEKEAREALK